MPFLHLSSYHILLADDDLDDCLFFKEALEELELPAKLTTVHNGEQLMQWLQTCEQLPNILFLDLNMPRKNGFACLKEIKSSPSLKELPVTILSTAFEHEMANQLYTNGAQQCFKKPTDFATFKQIIYNALISITKAPSSH